MDGIDVAFLGIEFGVDYVVDETLLFEKLAVVEEIHARKDSLEEASSLHLLIRFLDRSLLVLAQTL